MPRKMLTAVAVERIKAPKSGRVEHFDKLLPGFALRVTSGGAKSWVIFYRLAGVQVRQTLGKYPALDLADAREAARETVPEESITQLPQANMGGEDFGYYLQTVPGCYIRFGANQAGRELFSAHSSKFDIEEEAMAYGAAWYHRIALLGAGAILAG